MRHRLVLFGFALVLLGITPGCLKSTQPPPPKSSDAPVKIVFVGQAEACDCTRDRIDDSFNALQAALVGHDDVTIERLERDVDTQEVERLVALEPLMVAPGIYFLDANGGLVLLLQGEVTKEQVAAAF